MGGVGSSTTGHGGNIVFLTPATTSPTQRMLIDYLGNVVVGLAALAGDASDGFLYIPTIAGSPTGTPTAYSGRSPIVYQTGSDRLYIWNGSAWRYVATTV